MTKTRSLVPDFTRDRVPFGPGHCKGGGRSTKDRDSYQPGKAKRRGERSTTPRRCRVPVGSSTSNLDVMRVPCGQPVAARGMCQEHLQASADIALENKKQQRGKK